MLIYCTMESSFSSGCISNSTVCRQDIYNICAVVDSRMQAEVTKGKHSKCSIIVNTNYSPCHKGTLGAKVVEWSGLQKDQEHILSIQTQIMDQGQFTATEKVYAVVNNIPSRYHSADLRRFFSLFIETLGFDCFHFRHRPELQSLKKSTSSSSSDAHVDTVPEASTSKGNPKEKSETFCCIIRVSSVKFNELVRTYHQRQWQNHKGDSMAARCLISRLKTFSSSRQEGSITADQAVVGSSGTTVTKYKTRGDKCRIPPDRGEFKEDDLLKLPELCPPSVMPQGNVGTPTVHFMKLIQDCRLPPSIIKKLQLDFPKSKGKGKYGSMPFDYQTEVKETVPCEDTDESDVIQPTDSSVEKSNSVVNNSGSDNSSKDMSTMTKPLSTEKDSECTLDYKEKRRLKKLAKQERKKLMAERIEEKMIEFEKGNSESEDDNDTCEEWERHEAMYDDVSNQGRNKDRLFEEEMEIVWEKGGSGLVFYTDAQYWQEKEGDFDEQTADDLDVDMSAYYESGAGDHDIRDFLTIRQEQRRRRGIDKTDRFSAGIGKFERHTKGVGRKILEKQGWTEGSGLGSSVQGIADALDTEGQHPKDRKGLGYRGEKLVRYGVPAKKKRKTDETGVRISTIYDNPADTDPLEPLRRRNNPSYIKHRDRIN